MKWSLKEIAKELGISESTLRRYVQRHGALIPQRKEGGKVFFSEESLLVFRGLRGLYGELRQGAEVQRVLDVLAQPPVSRECTAVTDEALEERLHALASALERAEGALLSLQEENQRLQQEQQMEESRGVHSLETRLLLGPSETVRKFPNNTVFRKKRFVKWQSFNVAALFVMGLCAVGAIFFFGAPSPQASPSLPPVSSPTPLPVPPTPTIVPPTPTLYVAEPLPTKDIPEEPQDRGESYGARLARKGIVLLEFSEEEHDEGLSLALKIKKRCTLGDAKFFVKRIARMVDTPWKLTVYCYDEGSAWPPEMLWMATYRPDADDGRGYWKVLPAK